MNTLYATIKRQPLANILDGSKKIEYREIGNYWLSRIQGIGAPPFLLRLVNGMSKDAPEATVQVERLEIDLIAGEIRFHLGEIIEQHHWNPAWAAEYPALAPEAPTDLSGLTRSDFSASELEFSVPAEALERLSQAGQARFSLPVTDKTYEMFSDAPPGWLVVRLHSGKKVVEVGLVEAIDRFVEDIIDFLVVKI